jgi:hypothetical protein
MSPTGCIPDLWTLEQDAEHTAPMELRSFAHPLYYKHAAPMAFRDTLVVGKNRRTEMFVVGLMRKVKFNDIQFQKLYKKTRL